MPTAVKVKAWAKLNLTLDVLGRRADGYHELSSVMQSLALSDVLTVTVEEKGTEVQGGPGVPQGAENLAFRAVEALRSRTRFTQGIRVVIKKEIPVAAGLGGGSADAAAALWAVNYLLELGLTTGQLLAVAETVGADVPFCLVGGTALARGKGERLTFLPSPPILWLVLARPRLEVATARVYAAWDERGRRELPASGRMVAALASGSRERVVRALANHLEPVVLELYPEVALLRERLLEWGAEKVLLCGSGPTLAAVAPAAEAAGAIAAQAREVGYETWLTHTLV